MSQVIKALIIGYLTAVAFGARTPKCMTPENKAVDWFAAYKMPKEYDTEWPQMVSGAALAYLDANEPGKWKPLEQMINSTENPVGYTISQLYDSGENDTLLYALYSDQPPPERESPYGSAHSKGLFLCNTRGCVWLIHSIPGFPSRPNFDNGYIYPSSGHKNGQSILCLTIGLDQIDNVAKQLYINNVHIYDSHQYDRISLQSRPYLNLLLNPPVEEPDTSKIDITTVGGEVFTTFAKKRQWKQDLYTDFVAKELNIDLLVEGWRNGRGNIDSNCTQSHQVMNVESIHFNAPDELSFDVQFETRKDHSKWAVSADENQPWTCIGDINRQYGQFNRGGGTVCKNSSALWNSYFQLVNGIESCPSGRSRRR